MSVVTGRTRSVVRTGRSGPGTWTRWLGILVAFLVGVGLVGAATPASATAETDYASKVLSYINADRAKRGLAPLTASPRLAAVATDWSARMAATGKFEHNPQFSKQYPKGWTRATENIATGWGTGALTPASTIHKALMDSTGHKANILDSKVTHVGVGVAFVTSGRTLRVYVTENFAHYRSGDSPDLPARRTLERLAGPTRYETAVAISRAAFPASREVVIVAGAQDSVVDGLVAAPFAYSRGAPVLLSEKNALGSATRSELRRRGATTAWLIGGTGVLSNKVTVQLKDLGVKTVHRLSGDSRYATAAAVAKKMPKSGEAVLASGQSVNLIDAAAVSGPAAAAGSPVLLTSPNSLPKVTATALADRDVKSVTVVGGTGAVSNKVVTQLKRSGISVRRLGGDDRFSTATAIASGFASDTGTSAAVVTSGADANLIDAMTGGVLGQSTLLVRGPVPQPVTRQWIAKNDVGELWVLGGAGAVPSVAANILTTVS